MNAIDRLLSALGCLMAGGTSSALVCFGATTLDWVLWVEIPAYTCLGAVLAGAVGYVSGARANGEPPATDDADTRGCDAAWGVAGAARRHGPFG